MKRKYCRGPIAYCRNGICKNKDYPLKWGAPTCPDKPISEETDNSPVTEDEPIDDPTDEEVVEPTDEEVVDPTDEEVVDPTDEEVVDPTEDDISDGFVTEDEDDIEEQATESEVDIGDDPLDDTTEEGGTLMMGAFEKAAFEEHNRIRTNPE